MTAHEPHLAETQRLLLAAITQSAATPPPKLPDIILPSRQQSAAERLAVYNQAYFARLLDVLRELFPCTRFAVGDELFDQFAIGYLQEHPPRSYTLGRLADNLVEYLDTTRPADWGAFIVELARLEQAIDRIFDGPGPENLPPFVFPVSAGAALRLTFVPGFELHVFQHPVSAYYTDWKAGRAPHWPQLEQQFVAFLRRDYIVRRYELSQVQFALLSALQHGSTLGDALAAAVQSDRELPDALLATQVQSWFTLWTANQFFANAGHERFANA